MTARRQPRQRKRRGRPLDGMLVLDKPPGLTSNQALQTVKHLYGAAKAGHTGSLDPLATGVLPLCFGEATKYSGYLLDADKAYETTVVFGVHTATGDADGEVLETRSALALTADQVEAALATFRGSILQVPSMYSALKHQGEPLYKLARRGETVEREARAVMVHELLLRDFRPDERAEADLFLRVSKGTYVRSIAEDLGQALGCGAHVARLRRTQAGPFTIEQAVSLSDLQHWAATDRQRLDAQLLPVADAVMHLPEVSLDEHSSYYLKQGQPILVPRLPVSGTVRICDNHGAFVGVGDILDDGRLAPRRLVTTVL